MFMSVYTYVCINASAHGSQRHGSPRMLGLLTVLRCWKWVVGTKLQSSARSVHMPDCWVVSSAPRWLSFKMAFDKHWWCLKTWRSREVFWWSPLRAQVSCHYEFIGKWIKIIRIWKKPLGRSEKNYTLSPVVRWLNLISNWLHWEISRLVEHTFGSVYEGISCGNWMIRTLTYWMN